jgi:hypothetical protein
LARWRFVVARPLHPTMRRQRAWQRTTAGQHGGLATRPAFLSRLDCPRESGRAFAKLSQRGSFTGKALADEADEQTFALLAAEPEEGRKTCITSATGSPS